MDLVVNAWANATSVATLLPVYGAALAKEASASKTVATSMLNTVKDPTKAAVDQRLELFPWKCLRLYECFGSSGECGRTKYKGVYSETA